MKPKILLTVIALMSSAAATSAQASGDISADRYWTRRTQQNTSRSAASASHEHAALASAPVAAKADTPKCPCAMMSGAHEHIAH